MGRNGNPKARPDKAGNEQRKSFDTSLLQSPRLPFLQPTGLSPLHGHASDFDNFSVSATQKHAHDVTSAFSPAHAQPKKRDRHDHKSEDIQSPKRTCSPENSPSESAHKSPKDIQSPERACSPESSPKRQTMDKWSPEEDKLLREAVSMHGVPNWSEIARHVKTRDSTRCSQRWFYCVKPELVSVRKGKWRADEDNKLRMLVAKYKRKNSHVWKLISRDMGYTRNHKQCRERWNNYVDPSLRHGPWTMDEDAQLLELYEKYKKFGNKWKHISMVLPGRCAEHIRRRYSHLTAARN